jgi:hypothetical protein
VEFQDDGSAAAVAAHLYYTDVISPSITFELLTHCSNCT